MLNCSRYTEILMGVTGHRRLQLDYLRHIVAGKPVRRRFRLGNSLDRRLMQDWQVGMVQYSKPNPPCQLPKSP